MRYYSLYKLIIPASFIFLHTMTYKGAISNPKPPIVFNPMKRAMIVINGCNPIWEPTILGSNIWRTSTITPQRINIPKPITGFFVRNPIIDQGTRIPPLPNIGRTSSTAIRNAKNHASLTPNIKNQIAISKKQIMDKTTKLKEYGNFIGFYEKFVEY